MPRNTAIFAPTFRGEGIVRLADVTADPRYGQQPAVPRHAARAPAGAQLPRGAGRLARAARWWAGCSSATASRACSRRGRARSRWAIAAQAAIAIDNARLYEDAQREIEARNRAYEERDRVARTLQESLLPLDLPRDPPRRDRGALRGVHRGHRRRLLRRVRARRRALGLVDRRRVRQGRRGRRADRARAPHRATAAMLDPAPTEVLRSSTPRCSSTDTRRFCTAASALLPTADDAAAPDARARRPSLRRCSCARRRDRARRGARPARRRSSRSRTQRETVDLRPGDVVVLYTDGLTDVGRDSEVLGERWVREALVTHHDARARA